jgi:hypothetical protein
VEISHINAPLPPSLRSSRRIGGGDGYGISGPFLVRQALYDLSKKCNGCVVFVSVAGTDGTLDLDPGDVDIDDGDDEDALQLFRRNGACVDLSSNPFGWNDDDDNDDDDEHNHDENSINVGNTSNKSFFVTKVTMNNLQSLAAAIRQAASNIKNRNKDKVDDYQVDQKCKQLRQQQQQPIPIIFETMTPLLHLHGVERISILLKSLRRTITSTTLDKYHNNLSNSSLILSPIITPILYESISPSDHRTLEDCADAIVSLNLMDTTTSNSSNSVHVVDGRDKNSVVVVSGIMDLVRRGDGGGGNGKMIRHCLPVYILRSISSTLREDFRKKCCYWIIDDGNNTERDDGDATEKEKEEKKQQMVSISIPKNEEHPTAPPNSSRPKIYLEEDDPDFQDYDEDDDLDL